MKKFAIPLCATFMLLGASIAWAANGEGCFATPGGGSVDKHDLTPPHESDLPGVKPGHDTPGIDHPDKPASSRPGSIHSEGHGCGSIATGKSVEPTGCYVDKTIGVEITVHFLTLPPAAKSYIDLPSLR
jgi:hypothetical protein